MPGEHKFCEGFAPKINLLVANVVYEKGGKIFLNTFYRVYFDETRENVYLFAVAPLAGAWIEIIYAPMSLKTIPVAPLAGAWIEIAIL